MKEEKTRPNKRKTKSESFVGKSINFPRRLPTTVDISFIFGVFYVFCRLCIFSNVDNSVCNGGSARTSARFQAISPSS